MRVLAKEIVRSRQAVVRMLESRGTLEALDLQMSESLRNYHLSKTIESSGQMMKEMNKLARIERYQDIVRAMSKEMSWAGMLSEELHEGIDRLVDDEDVEDQTEEKVQEVLDEICGETLVQAADAAVPLRRVQGTAQADPQADFVNDKEVDDLLLTLAANKA